MESSIIEGLKRSYPYFRKSGNKIASKFYFNLFSQYPDLYNFFNLHNQKTKAQPQALSSFLSELSQTGGTISNDTLYRVAYKHCACLVQPHHYDVVFQVLMSTLKDCSDLDTTALSCWEKAIEHVSTILINAERDIYKNAQNPDLGGWPGLRKFKVQSKIQESKIITSFRLKPTDNLPVLKHLPGQYLTLHIPPTTSTGQYTSIRHYSLSDKANEINYRISVRRGFRGGVSHYLHTQVEEGETLYATPPYGNFYFSPLSTSPSEYIFVSVGIGVTPLLPMLQHAVERKENIVWVQVAKDGDHIVFQNEVTNLLSPTSHRRFTWYKYPTKNDQQHSLSDPNIRFGLLDPLIIKSAIDETCRAKQLYLCGPHTFMQNARESFINCGISADQIFQEKFAPQ